MNHYKTKYNAELAEVMIEAIDCQREPDECLRCELTNRTCRRGHEVSAVHRHLVRSKPHLFDK